VLTSLQSCKSQYTRSMLLFQFHSVSLDFYFSSTQHLSIPCRSGITFNQLHGSFQFQLTEIFP